MYGQSLGPAAHIDEDNELDTLIDEPLAVADEFDGNAQIDST